MSGRPKLEIVLAGLIMLTGAMFVRAEWIPPSAERHVEVAADLYDLDLAEPNRWLSAWSIGDGQAFAVIAADPTGEKLSEEIKEPHYRFSRAGYGWLAFAASLGQDQLIPLGMAVVGAIALFGNLLLAVRLRERIGVGAWILLMNPALYIGFAGDTAEPLAILLLTYALASGPWWSAIALGVTRPSYLLGLVQRSRLFAYGIAAALTLIGYSILKFGTDQLVPDSGRIGIPLAAYVEHPSPAGWVLAGLAVATLIVGVLRRDWAWILSGLLVICLGSDVTPNIENAWRAAGMLPVLWALGPGYRPPSEAAPLQAMHAEDTAS